MKFGTFVGASIALLAAFAAHRVAPPVAAQAPAGTTGATAYNVRVVTDASPDLTDLDSFVRSTTSRWSTSEEKVWALYYWSHILKRQTTPIVRHGFEVTDPIRNFNDYGFTMCSTISGINQTLYEKLGLQHQYWDICNHTVAQVYYNGAFHMIDSSMSNLVTRDDGVTLASLQEVAANGARLAKERSLYSTSPNGFLTGSDTLRPLPDATNPVDGSTLSGFADAYCDNGLKLRDYYYNWDAGHRYVLNVRENESYTRYYRRLGTGPDYYVSTEDVSVSDPAKTFENDSANRFGVRGNGQWTLTPSLAADWSSAVHSASNISHTGSGLTPADPELIGDLIYKVQAANAITSQQIQLQFVRTNTTATATVALSVNGGQTWQTVGTLGTATGAVPVTVNLRDQVNGVYETLVRIQMTTDTSQGVALSGLTIKTVTQVNAKALPHLNIGRNEVYIGTDDQTDTTVLWPELRGSRWQKDVYASTNIASQSITVPRKYTAVAYPAVLNQDAHLTYRLTAPRDFTSVTYGGRLHNYSPGSYIDFLHSFDGGVSWTRSYRLDDVSKPYDVIHFETVPVPPGVRTVLVRYLIHNTSSDAFRASGLYNVRMEGRYLPQVQNTPPLDVTLRWNEIKADRTTVARSHKQRVTAYPFKYVVNVGGSDHPVMDSMTVSLAGADPAPPGYSDGVDAGGSKYVHRKQAVGTNFAVGKPFTISRAPSGFQSSAGASNTTILTDGIVGAPATGSFAYWWGQCWTSGTDVDLRVDIGAPTLVGAFRAHLFGYPGWHALKGQVQDRVEVLTSSDGVSYTSRGFLNTALWKKDVPINHMLQDDEGSSGWNFELVLPGPVEARYVKYHVTPRRTLCVSELQVLDTITYTPFDIRIALPDASGGPGPVDPPANQAPSVTVTNPAPGASFTAPASVVIAADAADADGSVARVEFLVDGVVVSTDTSTPYSASWSASTAGTHTVRARAVDNAGSSTTSAPVSITVQDGSIPPQPGEDIVLWAATAPVKSGWTVTADASAAGGYRLQNPDKGAGKITTALASPANYFEMTFTAIGGVPYHLWIRGKALSNSTANDSVHVQFDGTIDQAGTAAYRIGTASSIEYVLEECTGCGISGWGWEDNGWGARGRLGPAIVFAASGRQTIRVQAREDGLGIDQIVISANRWLSTPPGPSKNDSTVLAETDSQPANQAPTVAISAPVSGTSVTAPATVTIAADANDSDGSIARVEFLVDGTVLSSDASAPYSATWTTSSAGTHQLTARAIDNGGATTTSAPVGITVEDGSVPPQPGADIVLWAARAPVKAGWTVTGDASAAGGNRLQNPDNGAPKVTTALATPTSYFEMTFDALAGVPYHLWIRGKALSNSTANDSVHVQFDGSLDQAGAVAYRIGTASSIEYVLEECSGCGIAGWGWEDNGWGARNRLGPAFTFASSGRQTIRIQAREDGLGIDQIVISSSRWLNAPPGPSKNDTTVLSETAPQSGNQPPTVTLTSPALSSVTTPATIELTADASDSDGSISRVDFYVNGTLVGTDTTLPWGATWNVSAPGSYTLTAKATDSDGAVTTSAPVGITASSITPSGDDIVLYAADATPAVNWSVVADASAAGGRRLQNPNGGATKVVTASPTPGSYFELTFSAVANRPYRLWVRGKATSNSYQNDSVFVQFDASLNENGQPAYRIATNDAIEYNLEECSACGLSGWGWQDNGWGGRDLLGPVLSFDHDGLQTIRIQVREDGLGIDQIVLSSVRWITTAPGPAKNDTTILPKQD